ncbi:transposase, partial [Methylacidiphilum caldifontis]|uniref:transposase n=1 Tax=Methylacidiphilum caldifontis TaxID=2795386 RepID=UPI001FCA3D2D
RVGRIHARIGNGRRDFLHKTSTAISKNHAVVFVEDLQLRNMSGSDRWGSTRGNWTKNLCLSLDLGFPDSPLAFYFGS